MKEVPHISIVSPVYRAEKILEKLVDEIRSAMMEINTTYEIIFVDDRSPDNSWEVMKQLSSKFSEVKSFRLSRNFGQHPTIMAGLSEAKGEWIVVMDCDLQDQPKEIIRMYEKTKEGYDIVLASRRHRQDGFIKKFSSKLFYIVFNYLSGIEIDNEVANFGIYNQKVIQSITKINDHIKFFPLFIKWVGFNSTSIIVKHSEREDGKSSYSFFKLLSLSFNTILSFSDKPLKIFTFLGLSISTISFAFGCYYLFQSLTGQIKEPGFSSLIISIWLLSGIIISIIGIVGVYLGKTFNQVKNRPIYIIDEKR
ncbi:glycosyltransferase family 2 protein [Flavobacterium luteum]|uniref:Glycosyltransferase family 2 protein n=1 Tax=Flavobacterium luteum TaxID=2026654 RepID=A0A7J5AE42_9FLAO|nr:glycosyltransferase family 2 protein [Flavobacterium luteum]KAB1155810.1 glycosyltransferase family 2 protein [Flavobacterium luteum]